MEINPPASYGLPGVGLGFFSNHRRRASVVQALHRRNRNQSQIHIVAIDGVIDMKNIDTIYIYIYVHMHTSSYIQHN